MNGLHHKHSCETGLLKIVHDIQKSIDNDELVALVLLDLWAAFETIDHAKLLEILKVKFGFSGFVHEWITSYLTARTFAVTINDKFGQRQVLLFGVSPGSILGSLLFILYTGELNEIAARYDYLFISMQMPHNSTLGSNHSVVD